MAIEIVGRVRDNGVADYDGLSTDIKPTDCNAGSTFWELDTRAAYYFSVKNINPDTGDGWWSV